MISYDEGADAYHANPAIGSSDIRAFMRSPILFKKQREIIAGMRRFNIVRAGRRLGKTFLATYAMLKFAKED